MRGVADWIRRAGIISWSLIGIGLLVYGVFRYVLGPIGVAFAPIAIALVVVYLLNPMVSAIERRGIRRGLGVAIIYLGFLAVVTVILSLLIPVIARQISGFIDELPNYIGKVTAEINEFAAKRGSEFRIEISSEEIFNAVQNNRETIISFLGGVRAVAANILHVVITVVLGAILSVYLLLDLPKIQRALKAAVPEHRRDDVVELVEKVGRAVGGFFRGQLLVATFVGVASAVGLTIIKLPFAVVIGLVVGIFNLVPLIGPFIGAIPAVFVGLLSGQPSRALWAMIVLLFVQQIDNHVISPNVIGRTVRLHPITVLLALLIGGTLAGIFGMLVVIPGVAAAKIIGQHFWARRAELAPAVAGGQK